MARPLDWLRIKDAIDTTATQRVAELEAQLTAVLDQRDHAVANERSAYLRRDLSEQRAERDRVRARNAVNELEATKARLVATQNQANQARADQEAAARNASQLASQVQAQGSSIRDIQARYRTALADLATARGEAERDRLAASGYRGALRDLINQVHEIVQRDTSSVATLGSVYSAIKRVERTYFAPTDYRGYARKVMPAESWGETVAKSTIGGEPTCAPAESPYLRTFTAGPGERTHVAMSDPARVSANLNHAAATGAGFLLGDLEPRSVLIDRVRNLEGLLAEAEAEREGAIARGTATASDLRKMRASASALIYTLENLMRTLPVGTPAHTAAKNAYDAYYKGT